MSSPQETEQKLLIIFKHLEETFTSKETKKIREAKEKLSKIFKDIKTSLDLLFQALSTQVIQGKEISLELHKSVVIYLKNLFLMQKILSSDDIYNCLLKIFDLIFNQSKENSHLLNPSILSVFQAIVLSLLSNQKILDSKNSNYITKLFSILINSIKNANHDNFLTVAKCVILLTTSLLGSKSANADNYEKLINEYYIPIINIIFSKVTIYIIPKENIYNNEFITILKLLLDGFYSSLLRTKNFFDNEKRKEIAMKMFKEYGTYCYELIQLMPELDENNKKFFGNNNDIIVFNIDENKCNEINGMKSKAIQFISFITQISTLDSKRDKEFFEKNILIEDNELIELINKFIILIVNSFKDILNNENKFNAIRKFDPEMDEEQDCYNALLFQVCVFLTRSLVREPIKSNFNSNIRQFLLDVLFPLIVTTDCEKDFAETDPEEYHQYINDIIIDFKIKNFRTSACYLVKKICDKYDDMSNFMLSYCLEMINCLINEKQISEELKEINIYLKNKDALINKFNDIKKLDFALLIILILKDKFRNSPYLKNKLIDILVNNTGKIHSIPFPIIKMKLCKLYHYFIPRFFDNTDKYQENTQKIFIENIVNYLLNNIIQKNLQTGEEYSQALSFEASDTIIELINLPKNSDYKLNEILLNYMAENLEKNFGIFNQLISNVDIYTFYLVIDHVIGNIKINQRNLIFECIDNLTKKFIKIFLGNNEENKLFLNQYFTIISSFLLGVNKLTPEKKEEIALFNEYFLPVINYIKNPKKFLLYEQLVSTMEEYIKCLQGINEESALILKNIKLIIEKDDTLSGVCFSYISTFLNFIQNSLPPNPINQIELFNDILEIIKKGFSIKEETLKTSKINSLLLTLQILSLNPNLNPEIFEYLILRSLNSFELIETKEDILSVRDNINQLALANVSLGFIFKPEQTYNILQKTFTVEKNGEKREIMHFAKYVSFVKESLDIITSAYYCVTLGKCILLGICGIFSNQHCMESLKQKMNLKIFLLNIFLNMMIYHKKQKTYVLNKMTKKETDCNFVQENEDEEEEEEESEEDEYDDNEDFDLDVEKVLKRNDNINNSDEFKFFHDVINNIKVTDKDIYLYIITNIDKGEKIIEDLSLTRNVMINYKNKNLSIPRKTVRIVRKNH